MKKLLSIVSIICLTFVLGGCSNKEELTIDKFKEITEEEGCIVTDLSSAFEVNLEGSTVIASCDNGNFQVQFMTADEDAVKNLFETNKTLIEGAKSGNSAESSVSVKNYDTYSLTTDGTYNYISRVGSTFLYVSCDDDYKDNVKSLIDKLGY